MSRETITVEAATQLVETRNLGVSEVMDSKRIVELPLNGRNPVDLLQYLPATVPQIVQLPATVMGGSNGAASYSLAGGLAFGVTYTLDGAMHNDPRNNLNLPLPFPDALQEFQTETNALTARNGMHSSGAVSAVTRSGTNSFRGDAFEFLRHHSFNATDPFATKGPDGRRKDDGQKRNQYRCDDWRAYQDGSTVLLLRLSRYEHAREPDRQPRVRSDRSDAGRRLHGVCVTGVQRGRSAQPPVAVRRQPHRSGAVQQGGAEHHVQAPENYGSVRAPTVWLAQLSGRGAGTSRRSTTPSTARIRSSDVTS